MLKRMIRLLKFQSWLKWLQRAPAYDPERWTSSLRTQTLQREYDSQGWTGLSGQWRHRNVERLTERIIEVRQDGGRVVTVLDVACFTGDYFGRLEEQEVLKGGFHYTGVDVTPKYLAHAEKRWQQYENAQFKQGSAMELPFEDGCFDIVFNSGMLIHVDDVGTCLREFSRVARSYILAETTVDPGQQEDFVDGSIVGQQFIDRVYRIDYVRNLLSQTSSVVFESSVTLPLHQSILFEAAPKS